MQRKQGKTGCTGSRAKQGKTKQSRTKQDPAGQNRTHRRQGKTGQNRAKQDQAGRSRAKQDGAGRSSASRKGVIKVKTRNPDSLSPLNCASHLVNFEIKPN
jgi:hypothetical protein